MALTQVREGVDSAAHKLEASFTSPLHDERPAAWLGMALGIAFSVCFLTGLVSHLIQEPTSWFSWPARPAGLYRVSQGLHVVTGIASIPLLLAKLWVVYPHFWSWPAVRNLAHAVERISLLPLVGGSLFLLLTGTQNIALWYPWQFNFTAAHYWASWITVGALVVHILTKLPIIRDVLSGRSDRELGDSPKEEGRLTRRGLIAAAGGTSALLALATVGQTFRPFSALSVLGPRRPQTGPQGVPVNKTAGGAGVTETAMDPAWRLAVAGTVGQELSLSMDDLKAMPQHEARLPISCVEGWSGEGQWRGVRLKEVLAMAGANGKPDVTVGSLEEGGRYSSSELTGGQADDDDTLLALELNGEVLDLDHGYPIRLIAPNRPGVLQTKWLKSVEVR